MTPPNHHNPYDAEFPPSPSDPYRRAQDGDDAPAPSPAPNAEVHSTRDVARIFGRTERTVRNWVRAGRLKRAGFGRSVFFSRAALDALLAGEPGPLSPGQYGSSL